MTALHFAAIHGNRRIVGLLVASGAVMNARNNNGCAVSACGESAECRQPSPRRRLPCRATPLHYAAGEGHSASVAELLLRGADGAVQNDSG